MAKRKLQKVRKLLPRQETQLPVENNTPKGFCFAISIAKLTSWGKGEGGSFMYNIIVCLELGGADHIDLGDIILVSEEYIVELISRRKRR